MIPGFVTPAVSIIVPAYNEEAFLEPTLRALHAAAAGLGAPYEIIVVDDGSTDRTAAIAREQGARVVAVHVRQIAAARNAGARAAQADLLIFVDADTLVPASVLTQAVAAMRSGAVGGGAAARMTDGHPRWAQWLLVAVSWMMCRVRWAAGCFVFARRDAFERAGGFDERYFASEEIHFSRAVKRLGRFVMIPDRVVTSGRKADAFSFGQTMWQFVRLLDPRALKRRDGLAFWYGQRGE
jgi:glycosyltransferase involved in cell wall biosynthesis